MYISKVTDNLDKTLDDAHTFYSESVANRVMSYGMGLLAAVVFLKANLPLDFEAQWAVALWMAGMVLIMDLLQYVIGGEIVWRLHEQYHGNVSDDVTILNSLRKLQSRLRKFYYCKLVFLALTAMFVTWLSL